MTFLSIGLPGRFADWCDAAVAALAGPDTLVRAVHEPSELLGHGPLPAALDRIGRLLIAARSPGLVVSLRQPDGVLLSALAETGARFLVALDHPHQAAADLLDAAGGPPVPAIRAVANSCATVIRFAPLPGCLLLHADTARADPIGTLAAIAGHLGLTAGASDFAGIAASLAAVWPGAAQPQDWAERVPAAAHKTMRAAFAGYEQCFAGRGLGELAWNRELFFTADPDKQATDILDLGGGQRTLIFGPYMHLPPSSWNAQVYVGVSPEAVGQTLLIEAYAGGELAAVSLQPGSGGIFATEVSFAVDEEIAARPIEIRVSITQHDAQGRLAFGRVVLRPQAMRSPDAIAVLDDFAAALDL